MNKFIMFLLPFLLIGFNNQIIAQGNQKEETQRLVLVEEFTSATCKPCTQLNVFLNEWLQANIDKCVIVKYQMSFPGKGDPYYTAEGGTRKSDYAVTSVPMPTVNGTKVDGSSSTTYKNWQEKVSTQIEQDYTVSAEADITGSFQVSENMIYVKTQITPYISEEGYVIYISINEKKTTGNAIPTNMGGNGEREFFHVMMKMLPDAKGTAVTLTEGVPIVLNFSQDLSDTFVEEMSDLEVAVFVQKKSTKAVLNAAYLTQTSSLSLPPKDMTAVQREKSLDIDISWNTPEEKNGNTIEGYNVYRNGVKLNTTAVSGNSYLDQAPSYGVTYSYSVAAISDGTEGYFASRTVFSDVDLPAPQMTSVEQLAPASLNIQISWNALDVTFPISGYNIYRGSKKLNSALIESTSYVDKVPAFGEYCYTVKAVVGSIQSVLSDPICINIEGVSINETALDAHIKIYPNPATDILYLDTKIEIIQCQIFDLQGQLIYIDHTGTKQISVSNLASGIYILTITTKEGSVNKRVVVTK